MSLIEGGRSSNTLVRCLMGKSKTDTIGDRIRGTLEDVDPLNKVPVLREPEESQEGFPLRVPLNPKP